MLNTYRNLGQKIAKNITFKVLKGADTVTRLSTTNKLLLESKQSAGEKTTDLQDTLFRSYIMCGSSKLGDGSVCGP